MAGHGWRWLELLEIAGNGWICLEKAGMAVNEKKRLEMSRHGKIGWEWLTITGMAVIDGHG